MHIYIYIYIIYFNIFLLTILLYTNAWGIGILIVQVKSLNTFHIYILVPTASQILPSSHWCPKHNHSKLPPPFGSQVGFISSETWPFLIETQVRGYTSPQDFINDRYGTLRLRLLCAVCGVIPMISVLLCIRLPRLEVWVDGNIAQLWCHSQKIVSSTCL